jgi:flavin reductase (DIM6/NTAB) family NADH-FMN oxidoreductase RutF
MPVVSVIMLSESPALVGVSSAPTHRTFRTIARSKTFSLSWLDRNFSKTLEALTSTPSKEGADKLSLAGLSHHPGRKLKVPVPDSASAVLECRLLGKKKFGDHVLLVGHVAAAYASEDFKDYWAFKEYKPILYTGWQGGLRTYN